jgi:hypothetical protein
MAGQIVEGRELRQVLTEAEKMNILISLGRGTLMGSC